MVQIVVLAANGEQRTMKTMAFAAGAASGAGIAKALRKVRSAEVIGTYTYKNDVLTVWGWKEGKAGTENKHELPPMSDGSEAPLIFGDAVVSGTKDITVEEYAVFYDAAFGGFEDLESEDEEEYEEEAEVEAEAEIEEEEEEEEAEEDGEAEEEEEDADDDCYDDGDENGGGGKRRAPRRRAVASPEYRRIDMGLRSRVKLPSPPGKRAPKWQTAEELSSEEYD